MEKRAAFDGRSPGLISRLVPAGILVFWFCTAVSALTQLMTIGTVLKEIPAFERTSGTE